MPAFATDTQTLHASSVEAATTRSYLKHQPVHADSNLKANISQRRGSATQSQESGPGDLHENIKRLSQGVAAAVKKFHRSLGMEEDLTLHLAESAPQTLIQRYKRILSTTGDSCDYKTTADMITKAGTKCSDKFLEALINALLSDASLVDLSIGAMMKHSSANSCSASTTPQCQGATRQKELLHMNCLQQLVDGTFDGFLREAGKELARQMLDVLKWHINAMFLNQDKRDFDELDATFKKSRGVKRRRQLDNYKPAMTELQQSFEDLAFDALKLQAHQKCSGYTLKPTWFPRGTRQSPAKMSDWKSQAGQFESSDGLAAEFTIFPYLEKVDYLSKSAAPVETVCRATIFYEEEL